MKLEGLLESAKSGKLIIHKYSVGKFVRSKYIYEAKPGIMDGLDFKRAFRIKEVKKIPYTRYYYSARTPEMDKHQSYKITSRDYKLLLESGAKEEI